MLIPYTITQSVCPATCTNTVLDSVLGSCSKLKTQLLQGDSEPLKISWKAMQYTETVVKVTKDKLGVEDDIRLYVICRYVEILQLYHKVYIQHAVVE